RSLRAPIETCSPSIATARRPATATDPDARNARTPVVSATRSDGNGCASRRMPTIRSDVHELREVRHEVVDQTAAAVVDTSPEARDESEQGDRGDDEVALPVAAEGRWWATAGCEHP